MQCALLSTFFLTSQDVEYEGQTVTLTKRYRQFYSSHSASSYHTRGLFVLTFICLRREITGNMP